MSTNAKPYKETLNLPVTRFEMKANLTARSRRSRPAGASRTSTDRSARPARARRGKVLHDGPPYANGEIHMGHLLNKVLKDFVVRSLTMRGFDSPYVPGWDCHGLPIEHKVVKDLGSKAAAMSHAEIRALCHVEAMKWVDVQRQQFRRLGVMGDWDHPYLTLDPRYEAGILDVLADLLDEGYVFRQLKPIHWCMTDRTALAEAELEYHDETTPSIYVNFPMVSACPRRGPVGRLRRSRWHAMIWTTTPWTLPANVAIAVHPDLDLRRRPLHRSRHRADRPDRSWPPTWWPRSWRMRQGHRLRRGGPRAGAGAGALPSIATRSSIGFQPDRAGQLRERRGRHRPGSHRPRPRRRGLPDGPSLSAFGAQPGRRRRAGSRDEAPEWVRGQQVFAANPDDRRST